jgi:hypothetical protein
MSNNWRYKQPRFKGEVVESYRNDGYWVEPIDINNDGKSDLIGYGLGLGEITAFKNPDWSKELIIQVYSPVGMDHADINGNGFNDIVICHQYGKTMVDCDPDGGKIDWVENPGPSGGEWKRHYIGKSTAMHRLRIGHFTRTDRWQVLGLPIVGEPFQVHSIAPVLLYTEPDDLYTAKHWDEEVIDDSSFRIIHGVQVLPDEKTGFDAFVLASEEGIIWMAYDQTSQTWRKVILGTGDHSQVPPDGMVKGDKEIFKGSGNIAVGKIGEDPYAYLATVEPFHGNIVTVYCKDDNAPIEKAQWKRFVLDVFNNLNEQSEGPGHHVVCHDFDGDGEDEFLVALRGPMPWQGVFYYKAVDVKNGVFTKWRVSSESAARIAVADFNGNGKLDFATMGYSVAGYFETANPKIMMFYNDIE